MKNCPFCGEEIQDTAKKCKHCKEWLKFKVCSVCGESVPENSEICPCCEEPFTKDSDNINTNDNQIEVEEKEGLGNKESKKKKVVKSEGDILADKVDEDKEATNEFKNKKSFFKNLWNDYKGFIIVFFIIIVYSLRPSNSQENQRQDSEENTVSLNEILSNDNKPFRITDGSKDYKGEIKYKLLLQGTTGGYILSNDLYSCFISAENIKQFVEDAQNGKIITKKICVPIFNNEGKQTKNIFVAIDNTYAFDEYENLVTKGPENRVKNLQKWLNNYHDDNLDLSLGFIYTTKPAGLAETVNEDIIRFRIQDTLDNASIKVLKGQNGTIQFNNRKIYYNDLSFVLDSEVEDCKESSSALYKYDCRDINALYNEIVKIYNSDYKNGSHSGNAMIEYFSSPNIKPLLNSNEHVYLFTDGQFELTENQESLKKKAKGRTNYNTDYLISNFSLNSYKKFTRQFEEFWDTDVIKRSKFGSIDCSNTEITIIGLISSNPDFTEYAQDFYSNKMFTGCSVDFQKLY